MKEVCQEMTEGDHVLGLRAEDDRALPEVLPDGRGKPAVSDGRFCRFCSTMMIQVYQYMNLRNLHI